MCSNRAVSSARALASCVARIRRQAQARPRATGERWQTSEKLETRGFNHMSACNDGARRRKWLMVARHAYLVARDREVRH
jgi:hypothetical protein